MEIGHGYAGKHGARDAKEALVGPADDEVGDGGAAISAFAGCAVNRTAEMSSEALDGAGREHVLGDNSLVKVGVGDGG